MRCGKVAAAILAAIMMGCTASGTATPDRDPDARGAITSLVRGSGGDALGSIRIEERPDEEAGSPKFQATVDRRTEIFRRDGAVTDRASFDDLRQGAIVEAWFDGPVRETYPAQATAAVIVIVQREAEGEPPGGTLQRP